MSTPTPCGCLAATLRLSSDEQTNTADAISNGSSIPSSYFFSDPAPPTGPGALPTAPAPASTSESSPSSALLQGRALTTHWTRLSTTCPNSPLHLSSPIIMRYMISALQSITAKYESHLWQMILTATTTSATQPPIPGLSSTGAHSATAGHIGIYRLEQDETQILLQEALRTSIEELGGVLSDIQRRVMMIRVAAANSSSGYTVDGGVNALNQMNQHLSSNVLLPTAGNCDIDMATFTGEGDESELLVEEPTDEEMAEINMGLYQCLRRLEFLENQEEEVGKDTPRPAW